MRLCESCRYYVYLKQDEFAGQIGQCRISPPVYDVKGWNVFLR